MDCFSYGRRVIEWSDNEAAFVLRLRKQPSHGRPILLNTMNSIGMERIGNVLLKDERGS